jgi:hypothetical protein
MSSESSVRESQPRTNARRMKKTKVPRTAGPSDELRVEYDFDYRNARPNRFADGVGCERLVVILDPDISQVFTSSESVNTILRALIRAMPKSSKKTTARR